MTKQSRLTFKFAKCDKSIQIMQSVLQCFIDKGISVKGEQANKYWKWVQVTFTLKAQINVLCLSTPNVGFSKKESRQSEGIQVLKKTGNKFYIIWFFVSFIKEDVELSQRPDKLEALAPLHTIAIWVLCNQVFNYRESLKAWIPGRHSGLIQGKNKSSFLDQDSLIKIKAPSLRGAWPKSCVRIISWTQQRWKR